MSATATVTSQFAAWLAQLAATLRALDPDATNPSRLHTVLVGFAHVPQEVALSTGRRVRAWPLLVGQMHRRDGLQHLISLADDLAVLAAQWDQLPELAPRDVGWSIHGLAERALSPPAAYARSAPPEWLRDLAGADIRAILEAAFEPVQAAAVAAAERPALTAHT